MNHWKELVQVFKHGANLTNQSQICIILAISALLLTATSSAMTVMNIRREFYVMAVITGALAIVFLLCAYLSGIRKMTTLPSVIAAICILIIFSYFAISGQNEGFAILWVLLVPLFAASILEIRIGIGLAVYFLIFSLLLFYTPLRALISYHYSASFMERFPVLYICAFVISMFIFLQKEFYSRKLYLKSNMDELTGTYNRNYFTNFILSAPLSREGNTCLLVLDINGLKEVNDTLGHEAGDELICAVSHCCREVLPFDFTLCRIGGDEFVLIVHQPEEEIAALTVQLKEAGQKWCGNYSQGCQLAIGWASSTLYPDDTIADLYRRADVMMYQDKAEYYQQEGKDRRKSRA